MKNEILRTHDKPTFHDSLNVAQYIFSDITLIIKRRKVGRLISISISWAAGD